MGASTRPRVPYGSSMRPRNRSAQPPRRRSPGTNAALKAYKARQGVPGPQGFQGPRGPSDVWNVHSVAGLRGFTETRVATLNLPAGQYLVSAHVNVTNYANGDVPVGCRLYVNYNNSLSDKIDETVEDIAAAASAGHVVDFPLQGTVYYTQAGYAIVACTENQNVPSGNAAGAGATLDAIAVSALH